jgi:hypothetical protein
VSVREVPQLPNTLLFEQLGQILGRELEGDAELTARDKYATVDIAGDCSKARLEFQMMGKS